MADNKFITSDIGIAAFLQLKGMRLLICKRLESGKFYFEFDDSTAQCQALSLEFLNSEYCQFDNNVRNLKKLLFSQYVYFSLRFVPN